MTPIPLTAALAGKHNEELNQVMCELNGVVQQYAVMKGDLYYRPNSSGYTGSLCSAGRYTKKQAEREMVSGEPMSMVPIPLPCYIGAPESLGLCHAAEETLTAADRQKYIRLIPVDYSFSGISWALLHLSELRRVITFILTVRPESFIS